MSDHSVLQKGAAKKFIPAEVISLARRMKASGETWNAIGRATGVDGSTIRGRLDPEYAKRRNAEIYAARLRRGADVSATQADVVFRVPEDTRSPIARFFGDPLPGRSALDQRGHS